MMQGKFCTHQRISICDIKLKDILRHPEFMYAIFRVIHLCAWVYSIKTVHLIELKFDMYTRAYHQRIEIDFGKCGAYIFLQEHKKEFNTIQPMASNY